MFCIMDSAKEPSVGEKSLGSCGKKERFARAAPGSRFNTRTVPRCANV